MVRQSVSVRLSSRRTFAENLAVRLPAVAGLIARVVLRADPRTRLRRAVVRQVVRAGFEAVNRGDYEAAFAFYHPEIEVIEPPEVVRLGLDPVSRGVAGRIEVQRRWHAEWGGLRIEPAEIFDLGDRLLVLGRMKGTGRTSGAAVDGPIANLVTFEAGRPIREEMFLDPDAARAAAGLRP